LNPPTRLEPHRPSRQPDEPSTRLRVIIDTDPGIDDVVTLALAARSPELDVVGVTTTYGNATLAHTTRNAREVLRLCGRPDISVTPGTDRPLVRPLVTAPETHGESGVGYAPVGDAIPVTPNERVLLDVLEGTDGPVDLITLGPLTNLALALRAAEPLVRQRVRRHIGMFGNLHERGNTNRWADFNAWCDPEAAHEVLGAGLDTLMVGLDVTRRMVVSSRQVQHLGASPDPLGNWLAQALRFYVEFHAMQERLDGCVVNDVLTVGVLLEPTLLTQSRFRLVVDLDESEHRGHTRERRDGTWTNVATAVDVTAMRRMLERVFGTGWHEEGESQ